MPRLPGVRRYRPTRSLSEPLPRPLGRFLDWERQEMARSLPLVRADRGPPAIDHRTQIQTAAAAVELLPRLAPDEEVEIAIAIAAVATSHIVVPQGVTQ